MTLSKCLSFFCRGYQNSQWYGDSRSVPRVAPRADSVKIKWSSWHGDTRTRASCSQSRDPRNKGWTHTLTNSGKWNRENINCLENGSLYSMCSDSGGSLGCGTTTISPYFLHPQITCSGNNQSTSWQYKSALSYSVLVIWGRDKPIRKHCTKLQHTQKT